MLVQDKNIKNKNGNTKKTLKFFIIKLISPFIFIILLQTNRIKFIIHIKIIHVNNGDFMLESVKLNKINYDENIFDNKIIDVKNLNFSFDNKKEIFKNVSFSINKGDFVCITGKNGSSKSTLLKIILNLIKTNNCSVNINTNHISYIPQSSNFNRDFPITVKEFLKYNSRELKVSFKNAIELCEKYELKNSMDSLIGKLSGGQIQKLMLVRALLKKTELLIVDEPTNNLDEEGKFIIYNDLKELNNKNITIVIVEHNKNFSENYANKIFLMKDGIMYLV